MNIEGTDKKYRRVKWNCNCWKRRKEAWHHYTALKKEVGFQEMLHNVPKPTETVIDYKLKKKYKRSANGTSIARRVVNKK